MVIMVPFLKNKDSSSSQPGLQMAMMAPLQKDKYSSSSQPGLILCQGGWIMIMIQHLHHQDQQHQELPG